MKEQQERGGGGAGALHPSHSVQHNFSQTCCEVGTTLKHSIVAHKIPHFADLGAEP